MNVMILSFKDSPSRSIAKNNRILQHFSFVKKFNRTTLSALKNSLNQVKMRNVKMNMYYLGDS